MSDPREMSRPATNRSNAILAVVLAAVVAGMVGLAFAGEPLYRSFCQVTGFAGTTQIAARAPKVDTRSPLITIQFDANVNRDLPWRFRPAQNQVKVHPGEETLAYFEATNISDKPIVGTAVFNVTPFKVGTYFNKIDCFCFTKQVLKPGETASMPVTFFVDPEMTRDPDTVDVTTITLSYTFYPADDQKAAKELQVQAAPATTSGTPGPASRAPLGGNG